LINSSSISPISVKICEVSKFCRTYPERKDADVLRCRELKHPHVGRFFSAHRIDSEEQRMGHRALGYFCEDARWQENFVPFLQIISGHEGARIGSQKVLVLHWCALVVWDNMPSCASWGSRGLVASVVAASAEKATDETRHFFYFQLYTKSLSIY